MAYYYACAMNGTDSWGAWSQRMIPFDQDEPLRRGEWTREEMVYVDALIDAFHDGLLKIPKGITLRRFLSSCIHCGPKRISKKMENTNYHGRAAYLTKRHLSEEEIKSTEDALTILKNDFERSVAHTRFPVGFTARAARPVRPSLPQRPRGNPGARMVAKTAAVSRTEASPEVAGPSKGSPQAHLVASLMNALLKTQTSTGEPNFKTPAAATGSGLPQSQLPSAPFVGNQAAAASVNGTVGGVQRSASSPTNDDLARTLLASLKSHNSAFRFSGNGQAGGSVAAAPQATVSLPNNGAMLMDILGRQGREMSPRTSFAGFGTTGWAQPPPPRATAGAASMSVWHGNSTEQALLDTFIGTTGFRTAASGSGSGFSPIQGRQSGAPASSGLNPELVKLLFNATSANQRNGFN